MTNIEIYFFVSATIFNLYIIKNYILGHNFSISYWLIYKDDYKKWYNFKQQYIPPNKRKHFKKSKFGTNPR